MCLKASPSRKVPQTLAYTTSTERVEREEWVAALLRLRTRLEIPEGNLRELRRDGNFNCGMHYPPVPRTKD